MHRPYLLIIITTLMLVACAAPTTEPTLTSTPIPPTVTSPVTITSTYTPSPPTVTPVLTDIATPTLYILPPLPDAILQSFFFDSDPDPACELPCWHGLVVGQSGSDEILQMLTSVFDIHDPAVLDLPPTSITARAWATLDSIKPTSLIYHTRNSYHLEILLLTDSNTSILRAISFHSATSERDLKPLSIEQVIERLGMPSLIQIAIHPGQMNSADKEFIMVYNEGLVFIDYGGLQGDFTYENGIQGTVEMCLGDSDMPQAHIIAPLKYGITEDLDDVQSRIIQIPVDSMPFEQAFDISLDELQARIENEENPCLVTDIAKFVH